MPAHNDLVARLREWTRTHDASTRAAVELLIEHGYWLRRESFVQRYVRQVAGSTVVDFYDIETDLKNKTRDLVVASSSELVMLRLAVSLARNSLGLNSLGSGNAEIAARAFDAALGVDR
jgi:hypothetical protein